MTPDGDPRLYFAAERTLLAWLRTGIAAMAFGFVVARFGLLLRLVQAPDSRTPPGISPYLGAALALVGVLAIAAGAIQYRQYCRQLRPADLPSPRASAVPQTFAWTLVALGVVLVVVLLV